MEIFEEAVLAYISAAPGRFVKPQYDLKYKDGVGGSCPDFVVIDYIKKTIYVVEVTTASDASTIISRIRERETRWFIPLKIEMSQWSESFAEWNYRVTLFVRDSLVDKIKNEAMSDVFAIPFDEKIFPWKWTWKEQQPLNPLE
ncbi:hypothetical protein H4684_003655 [Desulfomicrobium macestii]|uniref:Uncharacterized protein n=1 Tax=Desulfomicrobium macestii TaxID=90731 RepID=A0ABR9H8D8_9BACT|nr:hypothetical protein [Desulfomicrobium macestii]MBE1426971.1 hypothetical protein [Desulfomicrobium macestii]